MRLLNAITSIFVGTVMMTWMVSSLILIFGYGPDTSWSPDRVVGFLVIITIGAGTMMLTSMLLAKVVRNAERAEEKPFEWERM